MARNRGFGSCQTPLFLRASLLITHTSASRSPAQPDNPAHKYAISSVGFPGLTFSLRGTLFFPRQATAPRYSTLIFPILQRENKKSPQARAFLPFSPYFFYSSWGLFRIQPPGTPLLKRTPVTYRLLSPPPVGRPVTKDGVHIVAGAASSRSH